MQMGKVSAHWSYARAKSRGIGIAVLLLFMTSSAATGQFSQAESAKSKDGEHREEEHGLNLDLHRDEKKEVRDDLYRKALAEFKATLAESAVPWIQNGPQPAVVNSYLAQNGQLPGPNTGAVLDLAIDPSGTTDTIIYAVSNDGGLWKSTDGGQSWLPLTDFLDTLSFGAVALDPSTSSIVYAGTGSLFNNGYFKGIGVYKSTDGGNSWTLTPGSSVFNGIGINKMVVPSSGTILVATNQGMYRSTDGGKTYAQVSLGNNTSVYVTDLDIVPSKPAKILASVSGKGIYVSTDDGATFPSSANLWGSNVPGAPLQNSYQFVSLGVSTDGQTAYANASQYVASSNSSPIGFGLWKSTNGGGSWTNITSSTTLPGNFKRGNNTIPNWRWMQNCQCGYDQTLGVDPQNANWVYMGFQDLWLSQDGGSTWTDVSYNSTYSSELMHVDHHALVFSPSSHWTPGQTSTPVWVGNDGGIWMSSNAGSSWTNRNDSRATNLFRGIATGIGAGNTYTYGGMQDTGTAAGRPDQPNAQWAEWGGGDGGKVAVDPTNPKRAYGQWGPLITTADGGQTISWIDTAYACPSKWSVDFSAMATDTSGSFYVGVLCRASDYWTTGNYAVLKSTNQGSSFSTFVAAPSQIVDLQIGPGNSGIVWAGMSNGSVLKVPQPSGTSTVLNIPNAVQGQAPYLAVDPEDGNTVVAVFAGYSNQVGPSRHVFLTRDGGSTWNDISGGHFQQLVPDTPVYDAVIDSNTIPASVVVATDFGILRTRDWGNSWHQLGANFPNVHAIDLVADTSVSPTLVKVGTFGRSTWEISLEPTMLRPLSPKLLQAASYITWTNESDQDLALSWVSTEGFEIKFATLAANSSTPLGPAYFGGVNVIRDSDGNIVLVYGINGNSSQEVIVNQAAVTLAGTNGLKVMTALRSLPGGGSVSNFPVINNSSETLSLKWVDSAGVPNLIGILQPGQQTTVGPVYFGGVFTLSDGSGVVSAFIVTNASQSFAVNDTLISFWNP